MVVTDLEQAPAGYPRKRARTRAQLVRAAVKVLADKGPDRITIGEVASVAEMAPGTVYNHFGSIDDLIDAAADQLGAGVAIAGEVLEAIEHDPAARVALGTLQLLQMAETDPDSASAFVALVAARPEFRARVRALVGSAISDGADAGRFDVEPGPAAVNAVLGTALQSMRSRLLGETDATTAAPVAALVLRVLGLPADQIDAVVERAGLSVSASG